MKLKIALFSLMLATLPFAATAHHMAPEEMQEFITDQLLTVDSPHLLSSEDDPSLLDLIETPATMTDVDYIEIITTEDLAGLLQAITDILLQLEVENDVEDWEFDVYDNDDGTVTGVLYVDFAE